MHTALPAANAIKVFYIGLEKSGTSSFADFSWRHLNLTSLHAQHLVFQRLGFGYYNCMPTHAARARQRELPDWKAYTHELDAYGKLSTLLTADVGAWSDSPFPGIFRFIDEHVPGAKFVLWPRDASAWAKSLVEYYCDYMPNMASHNDREGLHMYGHCHLCPDVNSSKSKGRGNEGHTLHHDIKAAYENHVASVRHYFNATAERRMRLLLIDFAAPDAGRRLCEFVFSERRGSRRCEHLGSVTKVQEQDLTPAMGLQAIHAVGAVMGEANRCALLTPMDHLECQLNDAFFQHTSSVHAHVAGRGGAATVLLVLILAAYKRWSHHHAGKIHRGAVPGVGPLCLWVWPCRAGSASASVG